MGESQINRPRLGSKFSCLGLWLYTCWLAVHGLHVEQRLKPGALGNGNGNRAKAEWEPLDWIFCLGIAETELSIGDVFKQRTSTI